MFKLGWRRVKAVMAEAIRWHVLSALARWRYARYWLFTTSVAPANYLLPATMLMHFD